MLVRVTSLLLVLMLVSGTPFGSAEGEEPPIQVTEDVDVRLVLLEVVVTDAKGRHIKGLPRDAFRVREGRINAPIATFDEIDLTSEQAAPVPPPEPVAEPPAAIAEAGEPEQPGAPPPSVEPHEEVPTIEKRERRFVFLFDGYNNASVLHLGRARKAARRFLAAEMKPGDLAAVYEITPFLSSITAFTSDIATLYEAIDKVRYFPGESLGKQVTEAALYRGALGSREQSEERLLNAAQFAGTLMASERRAFYESIDALASTLQAEPGRKVLVFLSGGFPMMPSRDEMSTGGFTLEFKRMIRQLQLSEVTVFSLDIGEEKTGTDISQGQNFAIAMEELGLGRDFLDRVGLGQSMGGETGTSYNQILAVMANESGGRFMGGRDYERSLDAVAEHTEHFYLIGYRPVRDKNSEAEKRRIVSEKYRAIAVDVDRKGARVLARKGRIVTRDRPLAAKRPPATIPAAKSKPAVPEGHRLLCTPASFPAQGNRTLVSLPVMLQGRVMPIDIPGRGLLLDISTRVVARAGEIEVASHDRSYRITMKPDARELIRDGIRLVEAVELPPGLFEVEVRMRLNGLGVDAAWKSPVKVEPVAEGSMALSGLSLIAGDTAPPLVADVFTSAPEKEGEADVVKRPGNDPFLLPDGRRILTAPFTTLEPREPVMLYFRVYNAAEDPETGTPDSLRLRFELIPESDDMAIVPPVQTMYVGKTAEPGVLDVISRLDLLAVQPGTYTLRVSAEDRSGTSFAERQMEVIGAP